MKLHATYTLNYHINTYDKIAKMNMYVYDHMRTYIYPGNIIVRYFISSRMLDLKLRTLRIVRFSDGKNDYDIHHIIYIYKVPLREVDRGVAQERNEKHLA